MPALYRLLAVAAFTMLAGCQTALKQDYRAACPRTEVPPTCIFDLNRPGCGPIGQKVDACARFLDRVIVSQANQNARAMGFPSASYQNPAAHKIKIGTRDGAGSGVGVYVDSSSLDLYLRSLEEVRGLFASKSEQYEAAAKKYLEQVAQGRTDSLKALEEASAGIEGMKGPLEQAVAAGAQISGFYGTVSRFDYQYEVRKLSNSLDLYNDVLRAGGRLAISRYQEAYPYAAKVRADRAVASYKAMAREVELNWPFKLNQVKDQGKVLSKGNAYKKDREAAAARDRESSQSPSGRRQTNGYSGGGCSCSGGNVCYGPRGGRYCITSGGHKRYGI